MQTVNESIDKTEAIRILLGTDRYGWYGYYISNDVTTGPLDNYSGAPKKPLYQYEPKTLIIVELACGDIIPYTNNIGGIRDCPGKDAEIARAGLLGILNQPCIYSANDPDMNIRYTADPANLHEYVNYPWWSQHYSGANSSYAGLKGTQLEYHCPSLAVRAMFSSEENISTSQFFEGCNFNPGLVEPIHRLTSNSKRVLFSRPTYLDYYITDPNFDLRPFEQYFVVREGGYPCKIYSTNSTVTP
jgi:hypothetical protein